MRENNRNILKRAISHLPYYHLNDTGVWLRIEIELNGPVDVLSNLPRFKAPERTWAGIENKLTQLDSPLGRAIDDLPGYKSPEVVWEKIATNLDKNRILPVRIRVSFITKIAASVLVLISVTYGIFRYNQNKKQDLTFENMEYSTGIEAIYNPALCKSNPQVCQTELFKDLDRQREEIANDIETIESLIQHDDPQMMKYYHRLVNERVEIEKRLIRLILES